MLVSLKIQNFALIDSLELELYAGLNILTGETGAGKSIILDAIDAALGGKVSGRLLRAGEARAMIEATFSSNARIDKWLASQELEPLEDQNFVCSREITPRSNRTRLNGVVVNKSQIQALREQLVEITAQGQTSLIGKAAMQREWLDNFGGSSLLQQRQKVAKLYDISQASQAKLEERQNRDRSRLQQIDMLEYQLEELKTAQLEAPNELENLEQDRNRLAHSVELQQQSYEVYQKLYQAEDGLACADLLGEAESILAQMAAVDTTLEPILELVTSALTQVEEAGRQINTYGEEIESDPDQLDNIEARIRQLKQICRKYGTTLQEVINYQQKLQTELAELTDDGQSIEELEQQAQADYAILETACAKLTKLRQKAAHTLEQRIVATLQSLAMEKVQFKVSLSPIAPTAYGADRLAFEFSPNPGEPLQPLDQIGSGGEISRFLLALKTSFAESDPVGTMIFDEIDTGVSGRVSQAIALQLFQLSRSHQVLCVTHQPIIAAIADRHFHVSKHVQAETADPGANGVNRTSSTAGSTNVNGKRKTANSSQSDKSNQLKNSKSDAAKSTANNHQPEQTSIQSTKSKSTTKANQANQQERTIVKVQLLQQDQRKQELAQLAGGVSFTVTNTSSTTTRKKPRGKSNSKSATKSKSNTAATELVTATETTPDSAIAFAESLLRQADILKKQVVG
ncbi:DNA replication and repair protein RecN [Thalassoporum mexicanum PCC 7367]|uniref:DNA repair protein RecN n=1 Tax=Thalassoporum mexicanum TaxID=3457544 RepID=UPI00029FF479|nr:DNA repair protein RecN [Pseudanabaena sp. PCC 7367]AFY68552.1 DNA replication and repair protein RecN [Pseudanabaena sp. PCC 7367]